MDPLTMLSSAELRMLEHHGWTLGRVLALSAAIATVAVTYAEILFRCTKILYAQGYLKRYGPLPEDRNLTSNWLNAFGFLVPSIAYAHWLAPKVWTWEMPSLLTLYVGTLAYMVLHDFICDWILTQGNRVELNITVYALHRTFHASKPIYQALHAKHHEYTKATNVFVVGFAEVTENVLQVGVPWLIWTFIAAQTGQILLAVVPMSVTIFTTLLGHSGYKMHPSFFVFHPWAAMVLLPVSRLVLTPGDHQMHHVYRRCNMGLFFRYCDKLGGTYRQSCIPSHDFAWWQENLSPNQDAEPVKSEVKYDDIEVSFGF